MEGLSKKSIADKTDRSCQPKKEVVAIFTEEIISRVKSCVLCWLATSDADGVPNVSPKEMFLLQGGDRLLIANIASPLSMKNIRQNSNVCISMVDVFVQKGFKFTGTAQLLGKKDAEFSSYHEQFIQQFGTRFPIHTIIEVTVRTVDPIIAPSYRFFPETTTEQGQIDQAMERYQVTAR